MVLVENTCCILLWVLGNYLEKVIKGLGSGSGMARNLLGYMAPEEVKDLKGVSWERRAQDQK